MVIKRSLFPKNLEHIARGTINDISENEFTVKFPKKEGREKYQTFKIKKDSEYQYPTLKSSVICKYENSKKQKIIEILSIKTGKLIYKNN